MAFEANRGQTADDVDFLSYGAGHKLFLTATEAVLWLGSSTGRSPGDPHTRTAASANVRMKVIDANPHARVAGLEELPGRSNYFIGSNPERWRTDVPRYARVRYQDVYSGIDLVYHGSRGQMEYDFVVHPGADPEAIRLRFEGSSDLRVEVRDEISVRTDAGIVVHHAPVLYQEIDGERRSVCGGYVRAACHEVTFDVGEYDTGWPLIIDPSFQYSTYLGGGLDDVIIDLALDAEGNVFVTGGTWSSDFPLSGPYQGTFGGYYDAFVAKLDASGALVYSTFLGGAAQDAGGGIYIDPTGSAHIVGYTESDDFPTVAPFQGTYGGGDGDAVVASLSPEGNVLTFSTYLGGSERDVGWDMTLDPTGNRYLVGNTESADFPTTAGAFQPEHGGNSDAFVTKLSSSGASLVFSTFLGRGGVLEGADFATGVAVDASNNVYVAGLTDSPDFYTMNPVQGTHGGARDGFITKLTSDGSSLLYSTFLGGTAGDQIESFVLDGAGYIYVAGVTGSSDFPSTIGAAQETIGGGNDAFITKLNPTGSALIYSSYLGGTDDDWGEGLAVDEEGGAYVTGWTESDETENFPLVRAIQPAFGGGLHDAFATKWSPAGDMFEFSTFLGGGYAGSLEGDGGEVVVVGASDVLHVAGSAESGFPTSNAIQPSNAGQLDGFIAKISLFVDSDGDGILDEVDTQPFVFSNDFSDVPLGGTTVGTIVDRGDQVLLVSEEANPSGVRLTADATGGPTPAQITFCGTLSETVPSGGEIILTCTSAKFEVIRGPIEAQLGLNVAILAPDGTIVIVTDAGDGLFAINNSPDSEGAIIVIVDGYEMELGPGEEADVDAVIPDFAIDIKPGSCPNPFNRRSNGVLPVAVVGSDSVEVTDIDLGSVRLRRTDGIGGAVAPHEGPPGPHSTFEDVATAFEGGPCECHDATADGMTDLALKFKVQDVVSQLELEELPPNAEVELRVDGLIDGAVFGARDCVRLAPRPGPPGLLSVRSNAPGVYIAVTPLDEQQDGDGFANFERSFAQGTLVTLTAPPAHENEVFVAWRVAGEPVPWTRDALDDGRWPIEITMDGDEIDVEAVYRAGATGWAGDGSDGEDGTGGHGVLVEGPAPNPASHGTAVAFRLKQSAEVDLGVFDVAGRRIRTVARGIFDAGVHRTHWNGLSERGTRVPAGVYFWVLRADGVTTDVRKMAIVR